jgi:hypothetical protein
MGYVHIGVGVKRSLSSTCGFIVRAMAPGAVGAKQRIKSGLESFHGPLFVKAHLLRISDRFYVGSTAFVGKP